MAYSNPSEAIETLAAEIGDNVYIDIAKWHLYLRDAHLHTVLAERLYPLLTKGALSDSQISEVLSNMTVSLGGGKRDVSLADLVPTQAQRRLIEIVEDARHNL